MPRAAPASRRALAATFVVALWAGAQAVPAVEIGMELAVREDALGDLLRDASRLFTAKRDDVSDPEELIATAQADYRRLVGVLYGEGHYAPVVLIEIDGREAADIPALEPPESIEAIRILVDPGPRFRFGTAEIGPLAPPTVQPGDFAPGKLARSGTIRDAARAGVDGWRAAGHPLATTAGQEITADHRSETLDVVLRLDPDRRARFGELRLPGGSAVRPERIRAIAGLPSGEVFSPDALDRVAKRLRRAGAFSSVALREIGPVTPEGAIPIEAEIADRKPRRIGVGGEIASTEGLSLTAFWLHRNLLGGAERLRFDIGARELGGTAGGADFDLGVEFLRPATFTPDTDLRLAAKIERLDEPDFESNSISAEAGVVHHFSDTLTGRLGVGLRQSDTDDDFGERNFTLLLLPAGLTWDGRDAPLNATRGFYADLGATPFVDREELAPSLRLTFDGRAYQAVAERFVLAARVQLGSIAGASDIDQIPPDFLFFSGGGGTVRGQDFQELGVAISGNREVGGRAFAAGSVELRANVTERIGIVPFLDIGYVGPEQFPYGDGDWHAGAGLGFRYDIGIAPLRLDIATPVRGGGSRPVAFYIGIGQAF